jgi:hypothetical protein
VNTYGSYVLEGTGITAPTRTDWNHGLAVLTPEGAAAHIKKCCGDIPVGEAYCWVSLGGMPRDLAERHVALLCTDVANLLRQGSES